MGGFLFRVEPKESFMLDYAVYSQFLITVPLLLLAEYLLDPGIRLAASGFVRSGMLMKTDREKLSSIVSSASVSAQSPIALAVVIIAAVAFSVLYILTQASDGVSSWHAFVVNGHERMTLSGTWNGFVAVPTMLFVIFRWAWKLCVWILFLRRTSKLPLRLSAAHPDQAGGLGFIGGMQAKFGILIFAIGCVVAATIGDKIIIEEAPVTATFVWLPVVAFALLAPLAFLSPLLFFSAQLIALKRVDLHRFASLEMRALHAFEDKWLSDGSHPIEQINDDAGGIVDLNTIYNTAAALRMLPFDFKSLSNLMISSVSPFLPLLIRLLPEKNPIRQLLMSLF